MMRKIELTQLTPDGIEQKIFVKPSAIAFYKDFDARDVESETKGLVGIESPRYHAHVKECADEITQKLDDENNDFLKSVERLNAIKGGAHV